jgi:CheY-like chemotaxis protein/anti-sigma regulatory factor (Ser/Thr protein kinase)
LQKTNEELQEKARSNLAKDQFLAMLSHELRTPLTPVLASALALESEQGLPESVHESLHMIRRNVELEARLIDDLLDLTRISKGKVQLNFEVVNAHTLLRNAIEICEAEIEQKHLALRLDFGAHKVHLRADSARLQQIFWNLIKNAVKFTPRDGQISISTSNDRENHLRVEIADTGMGIDPESLPKIFDAFEQGGLPQLGGLGLGLAISKTLVEAHNGTITAESAGRNKGAKFTLTFATSKIVDAQTAPAISPRIAQRQGMRILLVEDHEDTNRSLTNLLRRRGYHVQSAVNLQSAIDLSAKGEFDVLISDLGLPDGSGIDLMKKLRSERPVLGIALTGFGMEDDIRKSHEAGFKHHLVKPIDLNMLDSFLQESVSTSVPQ